MKRTLLLLVALAATLVANAQFNKDNFGQEADGMILMKDGTIKKLKITMEHPDFMKKMTRPLMTSEGIIPKQVVQSFSYVGRPWVYLPSSSYGDTWAILEVQGAINEYTVVATDSEGKDNDAIGTATMYTKGDESIVNSEIMFGYKKKMAAWVADNSELAAKVNEGKAGYGKGSPTLVMKEYNEWFEKTYPGKLKYLPREFGIPVPGVAETPTQTASLSFKGIGAQVREGKEANMAAAQKNLDAQFAGRSATPTPEYASAKDNVPVKKETFAAKMQRIKADGNKIGVVLRFRGVHVNNPDLKPSMFETPIDIEGEIMETSFRASGKELVDELNAALQTTDIELIDLMNVPYREAKVLGITTRIDDWWASKYKLVFAYTIDPEIRAVRTDTGGKNQFSGKLLLKPSIIVTEYNGPKDSNKQDMQAQVMSAGYFESPAVIQEENITDINVLYQQITAKLPAPLIEMIKKNRADGVSKLVKKLTD